jgi:hypothetical protein
MNPARNIFQASGSARVATPGSLLAKSTLVEKRDVLLERWQSADIPKDSIQDWRVLDSSVQKLISEYYKKIDAFILRFNDEMKREGLVDGIAGSGGSSVGFHVSSGNKKVVMKLPLTPHVGKMILPIEQENLQRLADSRNTPDFVQRLSVDESGLILSKEGEVLVTDLLQGASVSDRKGINPAYFSHHIHEDQIPEIVRFYTNACAARVSLLDVGGVNNSLFEVVDKGKIIVKLFDFGSGKGPEVDAITERFSKDPLQGAIHHLMIKDLLFEGILRSPEHERKPKILELLKAQGNNTFFEYRFQQLKEGLTKLADARFVTRGNIVRSVSDLISIQTTSTDQYLLLTKEGVDRLHNLKDHFQSALS